MFRNERFLILIGSVVVKAVFIFNWRWILYISVLNVPVNKIPKNWGLVTLGQATGPAFLSIIHDTSCCKPLAQVW